LYPRRLGLRADLVLILRFFRTETILVNSNVPESI